MLALAGGGAVRAQTPADGWTSLGSDGAGQAWWVKAVDLTRHLKIVDIRFSDAVGVGDRHRERIDCVRRAHVTFSYNGIPIPDETESLLPPEMVESVIAFACRS